VIRQTLALVRRALSRHTTVAAYLALLLASSTATYAAATIGSAEVVNNSLQSVDLKDGAAVKGADVVNDTLTSLDIQEGTLNGVARKLVYSSAAAQSTSAGVFPTTKTVLMHGGYAFKATCALAADGSTTSFWLNINGPAGALQSYSWRNTNDVFTLASQQALPLGFNFLAAADTRVLTGSAVGDDYMRIADTLWIHSGATLLRVDVHALADARGAGSCMLYGTVEQGV
jgi:hypothetical protein